MKTLVLKADPHAAFTQDDSPLALYARRRWMNSGSADEAKRKRAIDTVLAGQSPDGSFGGSDARTLFALSDLMLLDAEPNRRTASAIDCLLEAHLPPIKGICGGVYDGMMFRMPRGDRNLLQALRGSIFTPGCGGFVKTGAALTFADHFGQGDRARLAAATKAVERVAVLRKGRTCSWPCNNNLVQAAARAQSKGKGATLMASALDRVQKASGAWAPGVPFFQTLHALAHIATPAAGAQADRALRRAADLQGKSGLWGRTACAFGAYAVLEAAEARKIRVTW